MSVPRTPGTLKRGGGNSERGARAGWGSGRCGLWLGRVVRLPYVRQELVQLGRRHQVPSPRAPRRRACRSGTTSRPNARRRNPARRRTSDARAPNKRLPSPCRPHKSRRNRRSRPLGDSLDNHRANRPDPRVTNSACSRRRCRGEDRRPDNTRCGPCGTVSRRATIFSSRYSGR